MPGNACERNGHTVRRPGFPFGSAFDFSALRTEHLCAPSFRQHAGTSLCARPTASAGRRRGPAPKNKTSEAASMRRNAYSGYSNVRSRATARRCLTNLESESSDCPAPIRIRLPLCTYHSSSGLCPVLAGMLTLDHWFGGSYRKRLTGLETFTRLVSRPQS
jgi:hypothetical protein